VAIAMATKNAMRPTLAKRIENKEERSLFMRINIFLTKIAIVHATFTETP
jgi:hypothetical protein